MSGGVPIFNKTLILLLLLNLVSCGMEVDEECMEAALNGQLLLINASTTHCDDAIERMEEYTTCGSHAKYLITLSSAYACKAGYNTTTFITTDVSKFTALAGLGGLATFTTSSSMDDPDNSAYLHLWDAINILLYAGGIASTAQPSVAKREDVFGTGDSADIHSLLAYVLMVQLGKYAYYYGNTDATGIKGSGLEVNGCLANYDDAALVPFLGALPGTCTATVVPGHPQLGATGSLNVGRMCEGVVLLNAFLEVFPAAVAGFSGTTFASLPLGAIDAAKALLITALGAGNEDVADELNYAQCVTDYTAGDSDLQFYFAYMFEALFP